MQTQLHLIKNQATTFHRQLFLNQLNKKFLSNKDFGKIFKILSKIIDNHNERLDALFKYIESVDRITDVLIEHTKKQDEYMINIPIIEIPEDWVVEIENNDK